MDTYGRFHNYLRISLTDRCNFRCTYCMPEDITFTPSEHLMQRQEIERLARLFVKEGVDKIRLTGGEPLVRKEAASIIRDLSKLPVKLGITTNGLLVDRYISVFKQAGLQSVNISLDTLQPEKFATITRRDHFDQVRDNIVRLKKEGFHVKVNVVMMRQMNEDEILDFVEWTKASPIHVRFIEFMPFRGNEWDKDAVLGFQEILSMIRRHYTIHKLPDAPNSTSKSFRARGHKGTFAVISTITAPFCHTCNRLRLTADGKLRNCLFARREYDLLTLLRAKEKVRPLIEKALYNKAQRGSEHWESQNVAQRSMTRIGG